MSSEPTAVHQLTVCNEHTVYYEKLLKAWRLVQEGKKPTAHWHFLKPELLYEGVQPGEGHVQQVAVVI